MVPSPHLYSGHLRNTNTLLVGPTLVIVKTSVMGRHSAVRTLPSALLVSIVKRFDDTFSKN